MKYNRIILGVFSLAAILAVSSCEQSLKESPKAITLDTFYNTEDDADAAIKGILYDFRLTYDCGWFLINEPLSDYNYPGPGTDYYTLMEYNTLTPVLRNGQVKPVWTACYKSIRSANIAIQHLPDADDMTQAQINMFLGEAKFFRAFNYYNLVRMFGGVPLKTEDNITVWDVKRSSADDIYKLIISDLEYASTYCAETPRLVGLPTKWNSKALLAEVYLQVKDYKKAASTAKEVMDSGVYSLVEVSTVRDFDNLFSYKELSSPEEVFYMKTAKGTVWSSWFYLLFSGNQFETVGEEAMGFSFPMIGLHVDNKHIANWDAADLRKDFNVIQASNVMAMVFNNMYGMTAINGKYHDPTANALFSHVCEPPLIRYADVLMTYAEAAAKEAGAPTEAAIEAINMIHRRAYGHPSTSAWVEGDYKLSDYGSLDKFMEMLIQEECYEFWNEGKRWQFLLRLGVADKYIKEYKGIDVNHNIYLMPIPDEEFIYNKALDPNVDQNPGY